MASAAATWRYSRLAGDRAARAYANADAAVLYERALEAGRDAGGQGARHVGVVRRAGAGGDLVGEAGGGHLLGDISARARGGEAAAEQLVEHAMLTGPGVRPGISISDGPGKVGELQEMLNW